MREILRRVALVLGVYGAIVAFGYVRPGVVAVSIVDFASEQAGRPAWSGDRAMAPEAFIARRTEGRRASVLGEGWAELVAALRADPEARRWILPGDEPLTGMTPRVGEERPLLYVPPSEAAGRPWLSVHWRPSTEAGDAPSELRRPLRSTWPWWSLGGLLLYGLIPRRKRAAEELSYSRIAAGVMPDVVGLLLGGTFFALALIVPRAIADDGRFLVPELWPVYVVLGVFVLGGLSVHAAAAWYSAYGLRVTDVELVQHTLFDVRTIRLEDIVEARAELRRAPRWLRALLCVGGIFNPRALAQALLLSSRADPELILRERGGRETSILLTSLKGGERLREVLGDRLVGEA